MNASWIIPFIIIGSALQACGAAMNTQVTRIGAGPFMHFTVTAALQAIS